MKNKNLLWIVAGAGAGVLAYFMFCKREQLETVEVIGEDGETKTKSVPKSGGGGGFFAPSPKPIATTIPVTPIPTTINILPTSPVVTTPTSPTVTTPTTTLAPNTNVTPVTTIPSSPTVTSPTSPTVSPAPSVDVKPTPTVTSPTSASKPVSATSVKTESSFSGMNGEAFEVGRLLNDL